jgi:hypothetical protein
MFACVKFEIAKVIKKGIGWGVENIFLKMKKDSWKLSTFAPCFKCDQKIKNS